MICLKNRTFAVSQTSDSTEAILQIKLWFAWKIVLLQYHKHPTWLFSCSISGCDLLEKSYFCSITNIRIWGQSLLSRLWFAWKIVLLQYHKHHLLGVHLVLLRCDLLEKSYFCSITNIFNLIELAPHMVVICLKNRTFAVSQTSRFLGQLLCL